MKRIATFFIICFTKTDDNSPLPPSSILQAQNGYCGTFYMRHSLLEHPLHAALLILVLLSLWQINFFRPNSASWLLWFCWLTHNRKQICSMGFTATQILCAIKHNLDIVSSQVLFLALPTTIHSRVSFFAGLSVIMFWWCHLLAVLENKAHLAEDHVQIPSHLLKSRHCGYPGLLGNTAQKALIGQDIPVRMIIAQIMRENMTS